MGAAPRPPRRDVGTALRAALVELERELLADPALDCSLSGSTGCVCVISGDHVVVANVGDSRALLVRHAPPPAPEEEGAAASAASAELGAAARLLPALLTIDHKPSMPSETRRILLAGGRLKALKYADGVDGPVRVWCRSEDVPGLAMSRSLCDATGKRAGVTSTPDVYSYTLARGDAFLVVASDGLFEFVSAREVADLIAGAADLAEQEMADFLAAAGGGAEPPPQPPRQHLQLALDALADTAQRRWAEREGVCDDVSIIVAEIGRL